MLSCKEATQRLSAAQDRDLNLPEDIRLKLHLAMCGDCRHFGKQIAYLRAACKRYTGKDVQDENRRG